MIWLQWEAGERWGAYEEPLSEQERNKTELPGYTWERGNSARKIAAALVDIGRRIRQEIENGDTEKLKRLRKKKQALLDKLTYSDRSAALRLIEYPPPTPVPAWP